MSRGSCSSMSCKLDCSKHTLHVSITLHVLRETQHTPSNSAPARTNVKSAAQSKHVPLDLDSNSLAQQASRAKVQTRELSRSRLMPQRTWRHRISTNINAHAHGNSRVLSSSRVWLHSRAPHLYLVLKRDPGVAGFGEGSTIVLMIDECSMAGDLRSSTLSEPRDCAS